MKRSDMLKNITDVLFYGSLAARVDNCNEIFLAEKDAEEVLALMEKLGMLPPYVKEPVPTHIIVQEGPFAPPQFVRVEDSNAFVSRWEDEA